MKKINEINDIESISVFHKGMALGYDRQKNVLFISEDIGDVIYKVPFRRNLLSIIENKLFSFDNNLYVYDEILKEFVLYRESLGGGRVNIFNGNFIENKYERLDKFVRVTMYKGKSNIKLWEKSYFNRISWFCRDSYLYVTDLSFKYIDFIDAESGEVRNTLYFENPPISRFIYHYEDTLIVSLNVNGGEFHLLGLDAVTGEEKWRIENAFYIYTPDNSTGLFYALSGYFYQVIDVKNGKLVCVDDLSAEMSKFDVIPEAGGCLTEDGIYFRGRMSAKFGLLNIHTHKFEFVEDLGAGKDVWTTNIQYHNGKVYVLDSKDVLHIWGK